MSGGESADPSAGVPGLELVQRYEDMPPNAWDIAWSADGAFMAAAGSAGDVAVWPTDDQGPRHLKGHETGRHVSVLSWHPDNSILVTGSDYVTVRLWDVNVDTSHRFCKLEAVLEGHIGEPCAVRFSPAGNYLASAADPDGPGEDGVRLWRRRDWECVAILPRQKLAGIGGLAFHPSRPLLAAKDSGSRRIDCFRIDYARLDGAGARAGSRRYGNAKVVLLGDTGPGRSRTGWGSSRRKRRWPDGSGWPIPNEWTTGPRRSCS